MNKQSFLCIFLLLILLIGCGSTPEQSASESGLTNAGGILSLGTDEPLPTSLPPTPTLYPTQERTAEETVSAEPTESVLTAVPTKTAPPPTVTAVIVVNSAATQAPATAVAVAPTSAPASTMPATAVSTAAATNTAVPAPTRTSTAAPTWPPATVIANVATATNQPAATQPAAVNTEVPPFIPPTATIRPNNTTTPTPSATPAPQPTATTVTSTAGGQASVLQFELASQPTKPSDTVKLVWNVTGVNNVTIERRGGEWGEAQKIWTVGNQGEIEQNLPVEVAGWPIFYILTSPDNASITREFSFEAPCEYPWVFDFEYTGPLCPEKGTVSRGSHQNFENGFMVWIEDLDIILYSTYSGVVNKEVPDNYVNGSPINDPNITAPAGFFQPEYGFGKVWRETSGVRDLLGWAIDPGASYTVKRQAGPYSRYGYPEWISLRDGGLITISNPDPIWTVAYTPPPIPARPAATATATVPPLPTITPAVQATQQPLPTATAPAAATPAPTSGAAINYFRANNTRAERDSVVLLDWDISGVPDAKLTVIYFDNAYGGSKTETVAASQTGYQLEIGSNWNGEVTVVLENDSADIEASLAIEVVCPYRWFYESSGEVCSTQPIISTGSMQAFEGGYMIWVQQLDTIYAFTSNGGLGWQVNDSFDIASDPIQDTTLTAPAGKLQPTHGFGKLWRTNSQIKDVLGWGVAQPDNYQVVVQCTDFARYNPCYVRMRNGWVLEIPGTGSPSWTVHSDWNGFANPNNGYK